MPYDLQGNFTRIHNWEADRQNDIAIVSDRHDEEDDNFAQGLSQCLLRDGRVGMSGDLNMGNYQIRNVATAVAGGDALNYSQAQTMLENLLLTCKNLLATTCSIGDIKASVQNADHFNWLLCDGRAVNRTEYAELFNVIGTGFGGGDGINTFNLPDYRGKFLRGLGGDSAADIYTTQAEGLPNIEGSFELDRAGMWNESPDSGAKVTGAFSKAQGTLGGPSGTTDHTSVITLDASAANAIYGASNHVTPVNQAVNWFIKAKVDY